MPLTIDLAESGAFLLSDESGHTIEVANGLPGLIFLNHMLRARQGETPPKIGTDARPTQAMVKAFLDTHKIAPAPPAKTAAQIEEGFRREAERKARADAKLAEFSSLDLSLDL